MTEQWQELKETITELRDNDGTGTQQEVCKFLANLMDILEKQMEESCEVSEYDKDHIWYRGKQYISLRRFLEVKSEKKNKPCEDAISRKDTIEWLKKVTVTDGITFKTGFKQILHDIEQMPPVTPQQKTGRWINAYPDIEPNPMFMYGICSVCGFKQSISNKLNYCPNCGAKMAESEERI